MKIAIAQLNPTIGNLMGNSQQILAATQKAANIGVRLLLTPELSLCGYPPKDLLLNPSFVTAMSTQLEELAAEIPAHIALLVGTVQPNLLAHQTGGKSLFNSIAWLQNGKIQQIFHKRLLPTYDVFDEHRYFEPASEINFFHLGETNFTSESLEVNPSSQVQIGVTICEDLWNDEQFWGKRNYSCNPIADLAKEGVDLIVNLSASPYTVGKQKLREDMLRHAALRYHKPIIYVNQVGGNDDLIFDGCSVAFNGVGECIGRAKAFQTDFMVLEIDVVDGKLQAIEGQDIDFKPDTPREFAGVKMSSDSPVTPKNSTLKTWMMSKDEEIFSALVLGVRDYARKCGFSKAVIGLSGGIDSSLVAAIATAALGADHVLGVLMPSPYSSDHSVKDALELAKNLGIQTHTLPIGELMAGYDQCLAEVFAGLPSDVTEENLQSRIRGNLLMAIANKFGHLLLSTGNKSEMAVGYCTLYGDMNGGLAVIADVPKTRVYSICRWLNSSPHLTNNYQPIIPENVITKAPSAELKPGQLDQDSLPPYDILDDILYRLIEKYESPAELAAAGHEPAVIHQIIKLVNRAEFKRRQAPPGLKVTDRAFGTGWRMPIAARVGY